MNKIEKITFEPDIDLNEDQIFDLENEIIDKVAKKLGSDYIIQDWKLNIDCEVFTIMRK